MNMNRAPIAATLSTPTKPVCFVHLYKYSLLEGMLLHPLLHYVINKCDKMVINQQTWGLNGDYSTGSAGIVFCLNNNAD